MCVRACVCVCLRHACVRSTHTILITLPFTGNTIIAGICVSICGRRLYITANRDLLHVTSANTVIEVQISFIPKLCS